MYEVISFSYDEGEQIKELEGYDVVSVLRHNVNRRKVSVLVTLPEGEEEEHECGEEKADGTSCERTVSHKGDSCWQH